MLQSLTKARGGDWLWIAWRQRFMLPARSGHPPYRQTEEVSEPFTLQPLALQLAGAAYGFGGFAGAALRGFLVVAAELHFAENTFPLHLLFQRFERLIDIVVTNQNLHLAAFSFRLAPG
jgi:hypothetical protein